MPAPPASPSSGRFMRAGVLALTVGVFAAVVAVVTWRLRGDLREQILQGFARNLAAVASMQLENYTEEMGIPVEDVPSGIYAAVAKIAKLRGVSGYRVYEADGKRAGEFGVAPIEVPPRGIWKRVAASGVVARLHDQGRDEAEAIFLPARARVVEVWIPLHRSGTPRMLGAAQFLVEEGDVVAELRRHDGRLWMQAAIAWAAGSLVLVVGVGGALRRLDAANRALRARSEELLRANRELVLAAKTSAVGAVTAHLMHELKTPIAGLESIVGGGRSEASGTGSDLAEASELTRRLRTMVNDIVGVLRDEQSGTEFELTSAEVVEVVAGKVQREAAERGVRFSTAVEGGERVLAGRRANLAILVLRNLVQNALEATPAGGRVTLTARGEAEGAARAERAVEFFVEDSGSGLPANVRERLFQPVASGKKGGSGLGLALSYQIAQQAGGRLELARSDERGTSFRLVLGAEA